VVSRADQSGDMVGEFDVGRTARFSEHTRRDARKSPTVSLLVWSPSSWHWGPAKTEAFLQGWALPKDNNIYGAMFMVTEPDFTSFSRLWLMIHG
jgi:hypothetical protein